MLALATMVGGLTSCRHTPMNAPGCREVPSVEMCQWTARWKITDQCLRDCVVAQCAGARAVCDAETVAVCRARSQRRGKTVGGYVDSPLPRDCEHPVHEISWCQEELSLKCRAEAMVHELAHSCGWEHEQGLGVPGAGKGELKCE